MNPKIALFLSASLTAFVLTTLSGVVGKVASAPTTTPTAQAVSQEVAATATLDEQPTDAPTEQPTPTAQAPLGPIEAASLAAQAINQQDVYSVESTTFQGVEAFKVVFSAGNVVFVGLDRQILISTQVTAQPVVVISVPQAQPTKRHRDNSSGGSVSAPAQAQASSGGGEPESDDD